MVVIGTSYSKIIERHSVNLESLNANFSSYLYMRVAGLRELAAYVAKRDRNLGPSWEDVRDKAFGYMSTVDTYKEDFHTIWPKGDFSGTTLAQFQTSFESQPQRLDKALVAVSSMRGFLAAMKVDINLFDWIRIRPAIYVIDGLNVHGLHLLETFCPQTYQDLLSVLKHITNQSFQGGVTVLDGAVRAQLFSIAQRQPVTYFTASLIYKLLEKYNAATGLQIRAAQNRPEIKKMTGRMACSTDERICVLTGKRGDRPTFNQADYLALASHHRTA